MVDFITTDDQPFRFGESDEAFASAGRRLIRLDRGA
jgi:hypothetical protein